MKKSKTQVIKVDSPDKMTPKQQAFVREYPEDFNATQAAIRAGYSAKTAGTAGARLLQNVIIQEEIKNQVERRNRHIEEKVNVNAEWVIQNLVKVVNRCMTITPVMEKIDGQWVETGEFTFAHSGANTALRSIGDFLGMWKNKIDLSGTVNIQSLEDVPTDVFLAILQKLGESGSGQMTFDPINGVIEQKEG